MDFCYTRRQMSQIKENGAVIAEIYPGNNSSVRISGIKPDAYNGPILVEDVKFIPGEPTEITLYRQTFTTLSEVMALLEHRGLLAPISF